MPNKHNKTKKGRKGGKKTSNTRRTFNADKTTINKSKLVQNFIQMLNTIKLYHWKTQSYSQHKATDELYSKLNENIDRFVEILLGKDQSRIKTMDKQIDLVYLEDTADIKEKIHEYREFLIDLTQKLHPNKDSDLLNVRDEILGDLNQFLYLLSFDK
jgi:DNA-binding ferritin-like protein